MKQTFTENENKGTSIKVDCAKCQRKSNQEIICDLIEKGEEEYEDEEHSFSISWQDEYQIIKCKGCDSISFRHTNWFSEDYQDDGPTERLYPKIPKRGIKSKDLSNLPKNIRRLYRETIDSFNNESLTLTAAGLRALVEGICAELGVTKNGKSKTKDNLEGKIAGLSDKGFLTPGQADILHEHRFLGNVALHELTQPSSEELEIAIEIIEHTLKAVFEIPILHTKLKGKRISKKIITEEDEF